MDNRRKYPRTRLLKSGKLFLGKRAVPCTVRNISEGGVCIQVQTTYGLPKVFEFAMDDCPPRTCKVVWQNETRIGGQFTT
jgi:hypothetical protein